MKSTFFKHEIHQVGSIWVYLVLFWTENESLCFLTQAGSAGCQ